MSQRAHKDAKVWDQCAAVLTVLHMFFGQETALINIPATMTVK